MTSDRMTEAPYGYFDEYITAEAAKITYGYGFESLMTAADHGRIRRYECSQDRRGSVTYVFRRGDVVGLRLQEISCNSADEYGRN